MDQRVRVTAGIIEDHPVVIEGITSWISADPGHRIEVVLVAHDLTALEPVTGPVADVIILDLELDGKLVTSQLARLVAAGNRIVAFSAHSEPGLVRDVLDGGAHAYVAKASAGRRMSITESTVRQYIDRARMKYAALGRPALSKDALLARAIEDGIITPGEVAPYRSQASGLA